MDHTSSLGSSLFASILCTDVDTSQAQPETESPGSVDPFCHAQISVTVQQMSWSCSWCIDLGKSRSETPSVSNEGSYCGFWTRRLTHAEEAYCCGSSPDVHAFHIHVAGGGIDLTGCLGLHRQHFIPAMLCRQDSTYVRHGYWYKHETSACVFFTILPRVEGDGNLQNKAFPE